MTRSQLTKQIANQFLQLTPADLDLAVKVILLGISNTLEGAGRVEIRGFGNFTLRIRPARKTRNPKTGTKLLAPEKQYIHFKPGTEMRERVNQ